MPNIIDALAGLGPLVDSKTGEERSLRDFSFKYLGLYFTATWCSYCVKIVNSLPKAVERVNSAGEFLKLITLRLDEDPSHFAYSYLRYKTISYDLTSEIASQVGARSIPSIFIYDLLGNLVTRDGLKDIMNYQEKTIEVWDRKMNKS
jgi:thiol-disulfide isomerase/thioredoxin